jgi:hypothetical protein
MVQLVIQDSVLDSVLTLSVRNTVNTEPEDILNSRASETESASRSVALLTSGTCSHPYT